MGAVDKMQLYYYLAIWGCGLAKMVNCIDCNYGTSTVQVLLGQPELPFGQDENKIYIGKTFEVSDIDRCLEKCQQTPLCRFFTYNAELKTCGIRRYQPGGQIDLPNTEIGTPAGILTGCSNKVLVGKTVKIPGGNTADCDCSCQSDSKCRTWTWHRNEEFCIHNYSKTAKKLDVPPAAGIVSGLRYTNCPNGGNTVWDDNNLN